MTIAASSSRAAWLRRFRVPAGSYRWILLSLVIATPTAVALLTVLMASLRPADEIWAHLYEYRLTEVITNTLWLVLGVGAGSALLGTFLGWLTAVCEFPGRKFFSWALLLPMAVPGYVMGFVVLGLFEYAGPVQSYLREAFGSSAWFPPVRSRGGIILVMTLTLYPYVYLLARSAFLTQGRRALEVARSLGMTPRQALFRAQLPLARPWIASGSILVMMETLADFGTVSVFNYDTFTVVIYEAWFHLFSIDAALRLALILLFAVAVIALAERQLRARARYTVGGDVYGTGVRLRLSGWRSVAAIGSALIVLSMAFLLPFTQLSSWALASLPDVDFRIVGFAARSITLAGIGGLLVVSAGLLLAYSVRNCDHPLTKGLARVATLGYALPGTVLAVSIFVPVVALNNGLQQLFDGLLGAGAMSILLQSTVIVMLVAYLARFLAVGHGPVESGMMRITRSVDEASRGMGVSGLAMLGRVHLPMLRTGLFTAFALVFVDIMKEMPITLMTRPFGWDTLAVRVFEMTSEGEWQRAALPAALIVLVGLIPVIIVTRRAEHAVGPR